MDVQKTGSLIAQARREKGLTQKALADCLHVSDRAVSKWERGINLPDAAQFEPLCQALGLTVTGLLRGERAEPSPEQAEQAVADAVALALRKEREARQTRRWLIAVVCLALVGLTFLVGYSQLQKQRLKSLQYIPDTMAAVTVRDGSYRTVTLSLPHSGGYFPELGSMEDHGRSIGREADGTDYISNVIGTVYLREGSARTSFVLANYGLDMAQEEITDIQVLRWPRELRGIAAPEDGEEVPFEFVDYAGCHQFRVEPGWLYSIILSWGDGYFLEFAFQTIEGQ